MHCLSTNYNEEPFNSAKRTLSLPFMSPLLSSCWMESCSPFTHAGILLHTHTAPKCIDMWQGAPSLARAHALLVTKTAAASIAAADDDGLINSFVLVCQHMLR